MYFELFFPMYFINFPSWKMSFIFVYVIVYCVGAGTTTLMSISDGLDPYLLRRKLEKTRPVKEEIDGKCLFTARVGIFSCIKYMIKVLYPICTMIWRVNNYVSCQGKV